MSQELFRRYECAMFAGHNATHPPFRLDADVEGFDIGKEQKNKVDHLQQQQ
jgi:hypothetical protein